MQHRRTRKPDFVMKRGNIAPPYETPPEGPTLKINAVCNRTPDLFFRGHSKTHLLGRL